MNNGDHGGGYREASPPAAQTLELDEVVKDRTRANVWLTAALCLMLLFVGMTAAFASSSLQVNCRGVTKQCQLDVTDHFGLRTRTQVLDMRSAKAPYWQSRPSGKTRAFWVEIQLSPNESPTIVDAGQGSSVAFTVLQQFQKFPDQDVSGAHSLALQVPFVFGAMAACFAFFAWLAWTVRVRITGVIDGPDLTLIIVRRLRRTRTLTFPLEQIVCIEARRITRQKNEPVATIDVVMKDEREDIFPSPLPNGDQVDVLASKLHRFVREANHHRPSL